MSRWLVMLERKKIWLSALAAVIAGFFYVRGDKLTALIGGLTASLGMFTVNEWGVMIGIILGLASFVLTWVYKQKYLEAIRTNGTKSLFEDGVE
jgi:uncharacterized membrane protein (DUF485 family)